MRRLTQVDRSRLEHEIQVADGRRAYFLARANALDEEAGALRRQADAQDELAGDLRKLLDDAALDDAAEAASK